MVKQNSRRITAKELLALLPLDIIEQKATDTKVDRNVKKLFGRDMFYLLLLSVLDSERSSLRIMQDLYSSGKFTLLSGVESGSSTSFTSLSDRLMHMNVDFFEAIFQATYATLSQHFSAQQVHGRSIMRFDSTSISASAKLLDVGMVNGRVRSGTGEHAVKQIKITIGFDGLLAPVADVFTEQEHLAEDVALGEAIQAYAVGKDDIVVFDRGLKKRVTFARFSQQGKLFVTRINPTKSYRVIGEDTAPELPETDTLSFLSDQMVHLFHLDRRILKVPFRLIRAQRKEDGQELFLLTNITDMDTAAVADIYRARWDIEVFFRFLKQELNLKHFVSYSLNGIKVWLYVLLIAAMLIMVYKKLNDIKGHKEAKGLFVKAIDNEITRLIVEICGGNPDLTPILNST